MKSVDIADASVALTECARHGQETLVVTRRGRPVAAVVPLRGVDMETLSLSTNADFIAMIEASRASYRSEGGITLERLRQKYGLERELQPKKASAIEPPPSPGPRKPADRR